MKQSIILSFLIFFSLAKAFARESADLFAFPPPGNSMHYEDIWNLTIILNPPGTSAFYFLEIEVEEEPGTTLWKAKSYTFKIPVSPFTVFPTDIPLFEPVNINFVEPGWYEKMSAGGGLFPPGNYRITYRLVQTTEGCTTAGKLVATTSILKTITALFPPSLLFPFNNDTLEVETPVFAWSPVMPVQQSGIRYTLKMAEISGGQTPEQALINNRPFLIYDAAESLTSIYPPGNMPLQKGNHYAWQVIATTTQGILSCSETWRFCVRENEEKDTLSMAHRVFLSVKSSPSGTTYLVNGNHLFIRYEEAYSDGDGGLMYVLSSSDTHENILNGKIFPLAEQKGFNNYALDITSLREGRYIFEITDEKGKKGYVVFNRALKGN